MSETINVCCFAFVSCNCLLDYKILFNSKIIYSITRNCILNLSRTVTAPFAIMSYAR